MQIDVDPEVATAAAMLQTNFDASRLVVIAVGGGIYLISHMH